MSHLQPIGPFQLPHPPALSRRPGEAQPGPADQFIRSPKGSLDPLFCQRLKGLNPKPPDTTIEDVYARLGLTGLEVGMTTGGLGLMQTGCGALQTVGLALAGVGALGGLVSATAVYARPVTQAVRSHLHDVIEVSRDVGILAPFPLMCSPLSVPVVALWTVGRTSIALLTPTAPKPNEETKGQ